MITQYIAAATKQAQFELMENGRYFASIPACRGCWAEGAAIEECRTELPDALGSWLLIGLQFQHPLPVIHRIDLNAQPAFGEADYPAGTLPQIARIGWERSLPAGQTFGHGP